MQKLLATVIILSAILAGCTQTQQTGEQPNRLYLIAKEAPRSAEGIIYVDLKKAMENDYLLAQTGASSLKPAAALLNWGGIIQLADKNEIIVVQVPMLQLLSGLTSPVLNLANGLIKDMPRSVDINYRGETLHVVGSMAYWAHDDIAFISKENALKKFIDSKDPNALTEFENLLSKLEDNDLMMVTRMANSQKVGVSASLEGNTSQATIIIEFPTVEAANAYAPLVEKIKLDGITVKSVRAEENYVYIQAEAELEKLTEMTELTTTTPGELPSVVPEDLPCDSEEECVDYCLENPSECESLLEKYSLNECCAECIKAVIISGKGVESASMQCSSFSLSANCSSYFNENQLQVIECYKGTT